MITNVLLGHPWLSPSALVLLVSFGPIVGSRLASRPASAWLLTGLSLLPVVLLTLVPVDREPVDRCTVQWAVPTPGRVESMANLVRFIAPVLLAGIATRRPVLALAAGSVLAAGLETIQALIPAIGRACDT